MKRVWGFILTFILILNTVITPGISARAQNVVGAMSGVGMQAADNEIGATSLQDDNEDSVTRPAIMRRADRILGLQQYDEYFIADSDAKIYRDNLNESYPASYLVEEARSRLGYTSLMSVINFANNEDFRSHPEIYRDVFCNITSVSADEWLNAGKAGLRAEYRATMFLYDYQGEELAELDGVRYGIYRTYAGTNETIELYLERKAGVYAKNQS